MMPVLTFRAGRAVAIVFSIEQARDVLLNSTLDLICINIPECRFCRSYAQAAAFFGSIKADFADAYLAARGEISEDLALEIVSRNSVDDKIEQLHQPKDETDTELVRRIIATYLATIRSQS